jgi:hypothetical protein
MNLTKRGSKRAPAVPLLAVPGFAGARYLTSVASGTNGPLAPFPTSSFQGDLASDQNGSKDNHRSKAVSRFACDRTPNLKIKKTETRNGKMLSQALQQ